MFVLFRGVNMLLASCDCSWKSSSGTHKASAKDVQAATVRGRAALAHIKPVQKTCRVGKLCQNNVYNEAVCIGC